MSPQNSEESSIESQQKKLGKTRSNSSKQKSNQRKHIAKNDEIPVGKDILSPKDERTSQVNMVIELEDAVKLSLSGEVTNQVEWKELSKQKDPMPKWQNFLIIAFGIAFVLFFALQILR